MGTLVTIQVVHANRQAGADAAIERAFGWFQEIEERCTRFDPQSELMQLTAQVGVAVPVSAILFEAVRFALEVAEETGGAFDPTVGHRMEARGFNREYRTGEIVRTAIAPEYDADLVVWDPETSFTVDPTRLRQRHKLTPYAGRRLLGIVHKTLLRGREVNAEGPATGRVLRRHLI